MTEPSPLLFDFSICYRSILLCACLFNCNWQYPLLFSSTLVSADQFCFALVNSTICACLFNCNRDQLEVTEAEPSATLASANWNQCNQLTVIWREQLFYQNETKYNRYKQTPIWRDSYSLRNSTIWRERKEPSQPSFFWGMISLPWFWILMPFALISGKLILF